MKKKFKNLIDVLKYIGIFVLFYILSSIFFLPFVNIFYSREMINNLLFVVLAFTLPFLTSVIFLIVLLIKKKKNKNNWIKNINYFKFYILFLILIGIGSSIKPNLEITIETANSLITIEWSLLAILLALLVTWCVIVDKEIKYIKNQKDNAFGLEQRLDILKNKELASINSANYLWNLIPALLGMLSLSVVSSMILVNQTLNIFTQSLLYFNMHLLTNAIILILMDILSPVLIKLFIIKRQSVSNVELQEEMISGMLEDEFRKVIIEKLKTTNGYFQLTQEQKEKIIKQIIEAMKPDLEKKKEEINISLSSPNQQKIKNKKGGK